MIDSSFLRFVLENFDREGKKKRKILKLLILWVFVGDCIYNVKKKMVIFLKVKQ